MRHAVSPCTASVVGQVLFREFGLNATALQCLPSGEEGWGYLASTDSGQYFVKLHSSIDAALDVTLRLTEQLCRELRFLHVVAPLRTKAGALRAQLDGHAVTLYPFIGGYVARSGPLTDEDLRTVGAVIGRLHCLTDALDLTGIRVESFDIWSVGRLTELLNIERLHLPALNEARRCAHDLLARHREALLAASRRFERLHRIVRSTRSRYVITHGDLDESNVLWSPEGRPYLIDWSDAALAPPERDLFFFLDERFVPFRQAYLQASPHDTVDVDLLLFYRLRWLVEGVVHFGTRIFFEIDDPGQNEDDCRVLEKLLALDKVDHEYLERARC